MKKSTKAALLSALVFPGAGHFYLKRKVTGAILSVLSVLGLYYMFSKMVAMTNTVVAKMQGMNIQPDVLQLREQVLAELASPDNQLLSLVMSLLMVVWFAGILDAYRLGLSIDKFSS